MANQPKRKIVTKKHMARQEREERQTRFIIYGSIAIVAVVLILVGIALLDIYILTPNKPVSVVNDEEILSSDYQDQLQTVAVEKPGRAVNPRFETSAEDGETMLRERVEALLNTDPSNVFISSQEVFSDPDAYFIINWERKDKYESGHIPGAIRYKPQGTLGIPSEMGSLPTDQTIVLYCGTGMSSAFAASYLRLFGYDARSLKYGNNSFMHRKMLDERETLSWHPFTEETPGNYEYLKF
jgi:rhodanese-related sulfurtransferase